MENAVQVTQLAQLGNGKITDIVLSPNGQQLAVSTSLDIYIYSPDTSEPRFFEDVGYTSQVAFSPDGRLLAGLVWPLTVHVWNLESGDEIAIWNPDQAKPVITHINLSPDGKTVAMNTARSDYSIPGLLLWDMTSEQEPLFLPASGERDGIVSAFSSDGMLVASTSNTSQQGSGRSFAFIDVWNRITGKRLSRMGAEGGEIIQLIFNLQSDTLIALDESGIIRLWDVPTGKLKFALSLRPHLVSAVALSQEGQILATGGIDGTVRLWQTVTGALLEVLPAQPADINRLDFTPSGELLSFTITEQNAYTWNIRSSTMVAEFPLPDSLPAIVDVSFDSTRDRIIGAGRDGTLHFWNIQTGDKEPVWQGPFTDGNEIFSPDGSHFAALDQATSQLYVWNFEALYSEPITVSTDVGKPMSMAFSPDNRWLVVGSFDPEPIEDSMWSNWTGSLRLWNLGQEPYQENLLLSDLPSYVSRIVFGPSDAVFAYVYDDQVFLYNVETDQEDIVDFEPVEFGVSHDTHSPTPLAFVSNDTLVVANGDWIQRWNSETGISENGFYICYNYPTDIPDVVFSPDGTLLLAVCDHEARLYDMATGDTLAVLEGHTAQLTRAVFNHDGTLIATTGEDGTVRLWGIQ